MVFCFLLILVTFGLKDGTLPRGPWDGREGCCKIV